MQTNTVLGVADVDSLAESAKLGSEGSLMSQAEAVDNGSVGSSEEAGTKAANVLARSQSL